MKIAKMIGISALAVSLSFVATSAFAAPTNQVTSSPSSLTSAAYPTSKQATAYRYAAIDANLPSSVPYVENLPDGGVYRGTLSIVGNPVQVGSQWQATYRGTVYLSYPN
ncbi:hypothetical protein [Paenibacillus kandeliae]|uniref:hypothetical protein n=1 Tax=Paenibacillus kandeliae TaxID=3231269 RepID=UPI00345B3F0F